MHSAQSVGYLALVVCQNFEDLRNSPCMILRLLWASDVANHARILMSKWSNLFMNKVESGMPMDSAGLGPATKGIQSEVMFCEM